MAALKRSMESFNTVIHSQPLQRCRDYVSFRRENLPLTQWERERKSKTQVRSGLLFNKSTIYTFLLFKNEELTKNGSHTISRTCTEQNFEDYFQWDFGSITATRVFSGPAGFLLACVKLTDAWSGEQGRHDTDWRSVSELSCQPRSASFGAQPQSCQGELSKSSTYQYETPWQSGGCPTRSSQRSYSWDKISLQKCKYTPWTVGPWHYNEGNYAIQGIPSPTTSRGAVAEVDRIPGE